jgi:hypothetical protein
MNIDEIKSMVQNELELITENKEELRNKLTEPSKEYFTTMNGVEQQLWIIGKKDEYYLAFDENKNQFGLAFRNVVSEYVYLGNEGSLGDAYEALISREEPSEKEHPRSQRSFGKKKRR